MDSKAVSAASGQTVFGLERAVSDSWRARTDPKPVSAASRREVFGLERTVSEHVSGPPAPTLGPLRVCVEESGIAFRRNHPFGKTSLRSSPSGTAVEDCRIYVRA